MKVPTHLANRLKAWIDGECGGDSAVSADLHDIYEICSWYIDFLEAFENKALASDDLEKAVLDLDINLVMHLDYHLKSLRNELKKVSDLSRDD